MTEAKLRTEDYYGEANVPLRLMHEQARLRGFTSSALSSMMLEFLAEGGEITLVPLNQDGGTPINAWSTRPSYLSLVDCE